MVDMGKYSPEYLTAFVNYENRDKHSKSCEKCGDATRFIQVQMPFEIKPVRLVLL